MRKYLPIIIILTVSLVTHFIFFGHPNETVFDEVHFGKFISGYFTHEYFFDIHPPLGKLLISGMGYLTGFQPGFSFANIGDEFPDSAYLWLRLLPTIAGTLLPIVIYFLALQLGFSRLAAFVLGIFLAVENSFIVQSRLILLDAFLLLFGFAALLCYFLWRHQKSKGYLLSAGIFAGLAMSVKWTGASFFGIIVVLFLFDAFYKKSDLIKRRLASGVVFLVILPLAVYVSTFVIHLQLLTKSGPGDAFMTQGFRKTLSGSAEHDSQDIRPLNLVQKVAELNMEMYRSNATLTATHSYASKWYTWPFMQRPIYYWYNSENPTTEGFTQDSRIYFLGNPVIWLLSTLAILYLILDQVGGLITRKPLKFLPLFILGGYVVNMLPFVGISRAMFLYHYMVAYVFAILALVYFLDSLKSKKIVFVSLIAVSAILFVYFSPLTYGLPLTASSYNNMVWFPSWR